MKSSLDKIFYKVVYHHIAYECDFFVEFRPRRDWFPPDVFPYKIEPITKDLHYMKEQYY
jgi:hypothetical protein